MLLPVGRPFGPMGDGKRPVFQALGTQWEGPPLNWGLIVVGSLAAALFIAAIVVGLLGY